MSFLKKIFRKDFKIERIKIFGIGLKVMKKPFSKLSKIGQMLKLILLIN